MIVRQNVLQTCTGCHGFFIVMKFVVGRHLSCNVHVPMCTFTGSQAVNYYLPLFGLVKGDSLHYKWVVGEGD